MKWLEIIELRSSDRNSVEVLKELTELVDELNRNNSRKNVKLYMHVSVKTDISIHLNHDTADAASPGSDLGLLVASNLKRYGLVNHKVWIEKITNDKEEEKK